MGITHYLDGPSPLLPGEDLLHTQKGLWLVSSKTGPSYRIGFNAWPLWHISFRVTTRRFRVVTGLFQVMTQDISIWYPGQNPEGDSEMLTGASVQKSLVGRCLEIKSENPQRTQWYWRPALTLRFYFKNPERVEGLVLGAMK